MIEDNTHDLNVNDIDWDDVQNIHKNNQGQLHRTDGPAVEYKNGTKYWCQENKNHRIDGLPAVEFSCGSKEWWVNGERHRTDGPAVIHLDSAGPSLLMFYINGVKLEESEFNNWIENNGTEWNEELEILFKLSYS